MNLFDQLCTLFNKRQQVTFCCYGSCPPSTTWGSIDISLKHLCDGIDNADAIMYLSSQDGSYRDLSTNTNTSAFAYSSAFDMDQYHRLIVVNVASFNNDNNKNNLHLSLAWEVGRMLGLSPSFFQCYRNPETNMPYGTK